MFGIYIELCPSESSAGAVASTADNIPATQNSTQNGTQSTSDISDILTSEYKTSITMHVVISLPFSNTTCVSGSWCVAGSSAGSNTDLQAQVFCVGFFLSELLKLRCKQIVDVKSVALPELMKKVHDSQPMYLE